MTSFVTVLTTIVLVLFRHVGMSSCVVVDRDFDIRQRIKVHLEVGMVGKKSWPIYTEDQDKSRFFFGSVPIVSELRNSLIESKMIKIF